MSSEAIKRVETAINVIKRGKMVIMMDDEDRENEGDLVYGLGGFTYFQEDWV